MDDAPPAREARFYREGDEVMFHFIIDEGNVIGPRPATKRDKWNHAAAWRAFSALDAEEDAADVAVLEAARDASEAGSLETVSHEEVKANLSDAGSFNGADPAKFDHDNSGAPGGSKPRAARKPSTKKPAAAK